MTVIARYAVEELLPVVTTSAFSRWPSSGSMREGCVHERVKPNLPTEPIKRFPTPRAQNGEGRNMNCWVRPLDKPQNLENAIARLLPWGTNG